VGVKGREGASLALTQQQAELPILSSQGHFPFLGFNSLEFK
jgi:hypothetical protein